MSENTQVVQGSGEYRPVEDAPEDWVGITEATKALGFKHTQYTRRLVLEGSLDEPDRAEKFQGKGYRKWLISPASIAHYKETAGQRSGMRRFILRTDLENREAVEAALDQAVGPDAYTLELAYKPKDSD